MNNDDLLAKASAWLVERRKAQTKLERDNAKYSAAVMVDQWSDFIRELLEETA